MVRRQQEEEDTRGRSKRGEKAVTKLQLTVAAIVKYPVNFIMIIIMIQNLENCAVQNTRSQLNTAGTCLDVDLQQLSTPMQASDN